MEKKTSGPWPLVVIVVSAIIFIVSLLTLILGWLSPTQEKFWESALVISFVTFFLGIGKKNGTIEN